MLTKYYFLKYKNPSFYSVQNVDHINQMCKQKLNITYLLLNVEEFKQHVHYVIFFLPRHVRQILNIAHTAPVRCLTDFTLFQAVHVFRFLGHGRRAVAVEHPRGDEALSCECVCGRQNGTFFRFLVFIMFGVSAVMTYHR